MGVFWSAETFDPIDHLRLSLVQEVFVFFSGLLIQLGVKCKW